MSQTISRGCAAGRLTVRFTVTTPDSGATADATVRPMDGVPDTYDVAFVVTAPGTLSIEKVTVAVEFSAADMHGMYHPYGNVDQLTRLPFWSREYRSSATQAPPLWSFIHQSGRNRVAFGLGDQLTPTHVRHTMSEHTRSIVLGAELPTDGTVLRRGDGRYELHAFVSTADVPLRQLIAAYGAFVDRVQPQPVLAVPDAAYDPVFCTWTAMHVDVTPEWTERNAAIARELGFKTLLMDDGWQDWPADAPDDRLAGGQTYAHNGEWVPHRTKFPDFAGHVKRIHDLGMRYLLWVAPFFLGAKSKPYAQLGNLGFRTGTGRAWEGSAFLDPRYPQVQQFIRSTLMRLMRDYHLDGLKIDFVDGIGSKIEPHMPPVPDGAEGGPALQELLGSIVDELRRDVPDLMIECRQGYSNLAARRWTNCYRSPDVPINFHANRFNCAMLRLLVPDRAVYFDPALWPMDDPDENVGRHMISAVAQVPMISIEFDKYPKSHLDIVRHWIAFYDAHRATILQGEFEPRIALGHNPYTVFTSRRETIVGLYADYHLDLPLWAGDLYVLNGSSSQAVSVTPPSPGEVVIERFSRFGIRCGESQGPMRVYLDVPVGGYARIRHVGTTPPRPSAG